ncbi:digalactosyldiacylglycerol synthase 2, chloroplastic-like [Neltuma alba]|uniref:digalactosyldiacylglycerol synthase 2, chloroplastic-like n=1 Tax=Neltuma alba TaxID=207710 RepID=UPI0010A56EF3|nr:digalactosyldiacylglycerol synthase 2, chloroplastic-like [Prosopis alba]
MNEEPVQLTDAHRHELSWEAATERFLKAAELDKPLVKQLSRSTSNNYLSTSLNVQQRVEDVSTYIHHIASGFEASRRLFGAIPGSLQPDEQLCKDLGLATSGNQGSRK